MVHELIGIQNNKADLRNISKFPKDQQVGLLFSFAYYLLNILY